MASHRRGSSLRPPCMKEQISFRVERVIPDVGCSINRFEIKFVCPLPSKCDARPPFERCDADASPFRFFSAELRRVECQPCPYSARRDTEFGLAAEASRRSSSQISGVGSQRGRSAVGSKRKICGLFANSLEEPSAELGGRGAIPPVPKFSVFLPESELQHGPVPMGRRRSSIGRAGHDKRVSFGLGFGNPPLAPPRANLRAVGVASASLRRPVR